MLSKILRMTGRCSSLRSSVVVHPHRMPAPMQPLAIPTRVMSHLIPPSQYDMPWPKKFQQLYVMRVYWETIPLFFTTYFAIGILVVYIAWALNNKMEIVFSTHSRANISRTMDLRNPSIHKLVTLNQRYNPWPEMQEVLDKMKDAEKRALTRAESCSRP